MKLDSRILEGKKPLTCFDTEEAKRFIGKECYFSNYLCNFNNINSIAPRALLHNITEDKDASNPYYSCPGYFAYCLPCEWVEEKKEPKYRPFSLEEFLKIFDVGDQIGFRSKDNGEVKYAMFVGYTDDFFADNTDRSDGENDVMIGIYRFSLSYLFENYDLYFEDEWQPFGIEE